MMNSISTKLLVDRPTMKTRFPRFPRPPLPTRAQLTGLTAYLSFYAGSWLLGFATLTGLGVLIPHCFKLDICYTLVHCMIFGSGYFADRLGGGE
jgi:hypothetical protein